MAEVEQEFRRSIDALAGVFSFSESFLSQEGIAEAHSFGVNFALEELFTNMVKYSTESANDIRIELKRQGATLTIRLIDRDVEPFDVTAAPDADVAKPLAERTPGGLGLHLIRRFMDGIDYRYENRTSIITLTKQLETERREPQC